MKWWDGWNGLEYHIDEELMAGVNHTRAQLELIGCAFIIVLFIVFILLWLAIEMLLIVLRNETLYTEANRPRKIMYDHNEDDESKTHLACENYGSVLIK